MSVGSELIEDDESSLMLKRVGCGVGFFVAVVVAPQVTAMYTNENAYNFYSDTAIGNMPNIVATTVVGPVLLAVAVLCLALFGECMQAIEDTEEEALEDWRSTPWTSSDELKWRREQRKQGNYV